MYYSYHWTEDEDIAFNIFSDAWRADKSVVETPGMGSYKYIKTNDEGYGGTDLLVDGFECGK